MPVIFVAAPEDTTVIVSFLMVHRLAGIPVKLVASFVGESPAPSVGVGVQTVVQPEPCSRGYFIHSQMMSDISVLVSFIDVTQESSHRGTFHLNLLKRLVKSNILFNRLE